MRRFALLAVLIWPGTISAEEAWTRMDGDEIRQALTGSANLLLMEKIAESLAGRAGYVTLGPLTRGEMLGQGRVGLWDLFARKPPGTWIDGVAASGFPQAPWADVVLLGGFPTPAYELADPEAIDRADVEAKLRKMSEALR